MGLGNIAVIEHINGLFGVTEADKLRKKIKNLSPKERELTIVEAIVKALQKVGGQYILPFCFKNKNRNFTSHHLIFVSKHHRGYQIMKEIMAKQSSSQEQGVSTFEYNPATVNQPLLFEFNRPLDDLMDILLNEFTNQTLTVEEIYFLHNVGTQYIMKNYKEALKNLELQGKIKIVPSVNERRKNTLKNTALITFY